MKTGFPGYRTFQAGLLLVALALPGLAAPAGAQINVCVEPADSTIALGDVVTVRVTTDGPMADLKGYLVRLTYNPAVLALGAITPGNVLDGHLATFIPFAAPADTAGFDAAVLIGSTDGPGTLGYIQFTGIANGVSDLRIVEVIMRNSLNQSFPVTTCDGRIRVIAPVPVENETWGGIKSLMVSHRPR
jgi:hypothetical protein